MDDEIGKNMMKRYIFCISLMVLLVFVRGFGQTEKADSLLNLFDSKQTVGVANQLFDLFDAEELTDDHREIGHDERLLWLSLKIGGILDMYYIEIS